MQAPSQNRLAGKLFIKRLERPGGAKHKVYVILHYSSDKAP
jgi:hypothetical protein